MGDKTGAFADHGQGTIGGYHHAYKSWGRTRRPKALYDDNAIASKQTATSVTVVASGDLAADLDSADAGKNGYSTENQRFLHVQMENDDTDDTLTLYAYNYAFGAWAPYYVEISGPTSAQNSRVIATWTTINGEKLIIVPIGGIDRIAFVHDGTLNDMVVRAACTSF